jgi:kynurenine formamidase
MEHRVEFDFEVTFADGGGVQGQRFRLDIVAVRNKRVLDEPHKRPPGAQAAPSARPPGDRGARRLVDLSHPILDGMVTYRGLPAPQITDFISREASRANYAPGTEFQIGRIDMVANTGTYLDSPFHRFADGTDIAGLSLEALADLPALVIRATGLTGRAVEGRLIAAALADQAVDRWAVLVQTGWGDANWGTDAYFEGHPYLTAGAVDALVAARPALVGIDTYNIDDTADLTRPAHTGLLRAGVPIIEHMHRLGELPITGARFFAVPAPIQGMGTFPVRAWASVPTEASAA